jgi:transitional endoplasmic reticulum ATPase
MDVYLSSPKMEEMGLFWGNKVFIKGKDKKYTVGFIVADDFCENEKIKINSGGRNNVNVKLGDIVTIYHFVKKIFILPFDDSLTENYRDLFESYLKPYFIGAYRPVKKNEKLLVNGTLGTMDFQVIEIDPEVNDYCIVGPYTNIFCEGEPLKKEESESPKKIFLEIVRGKNFWLLLLAIGLCRVSRDKKKKKKIFFDSKMI